MLRPGSSESARALESERRRLLLRYSRHGRKDDLERLVLSYRPLARALARRYETVGARDDLEQAACEGLIKAIQRFDPDRGCAFTSFAVPTILGELRRYRRDTGWAVRVPRALQERVQAVRTATDRLTAAWGRAPTVRELADWVGCDEEEVIEALCATTSLSVVPLDGPSGADGDAGDAVVDRLGIAEPGYEQVEYLEAIEGALGALNPTEMTVIKLRFADDLTQREIAGRLEVSRSEVARVLSGAVERLRSVALSGSPA
jgi:RNA polymerase sigma-B factor